jgi:penicillin amidase
MSDRSRGLRRALAFVAAIALLLVVAGGVWLRRELRASLPTLDGAVRLSGLSAAVSITRDSFGIPTIRGTSREDVARATGFLHAQDRFFQMDLTRRRAAGELAELVGLRALPLDREMRIHRFRAEALQATSLLTPRDRAVLDAYTAGVNAGLAALGAHPFEYLVLRQTPRPWREEDTFLVVLSMFVTLQDTEGAYESTLATMRDVLPAPMFDFLAPPGTEWDAPMIGPAFAMPSVPGREIYDLRARRAGKPRIHLPPRSQDVVRTGVRQDSFVSGWASAINSRQEAVGSNSWVVSGKLTGDGRPLLANDMHLPVRVPNTWYRAALHWRDPSQESGEQALIGVTLPGVPAVVVGSNTHVAWGFTNTYADWSDIVLLEGDPHNANRYRTPGGWRDFDRHDETIKVAGQPDQVEVVNWTIWGPVLPPDHMGHRRAYRWVAHAADRLATSLNPLEQARTVEEAFDAANGIGTPGQNLVVADTSGSIGWSVYGAIPRRIGMDGRLPGSWADGTRGWNGWLNRNEYPRILNPASGRIWTANARVVDGDMLAKLGDGSYEVGSRATIIRNRLMAQERFTNADLLRIQLDTSADFLARWRELILRTITQAATTGHPDRATFRDIVESGWSGHASPDSVAYRLTRVFREQVVTHVIRFLLAECYEADPEFDYLTVRRREGPIWTLVTEKPQHLLDPQYATWNDLLLAAVDEVISQALGERSGSLRDRVWSEYNVTAYRHPLSASLPLIGRWLDMPIRPLPGDLFTPRMHWGSAAPSERMVVSPGREAEGIMHMPTGQSGHPLSPFYGSSHQAWVNGDPTPFLPGAPKHTLTLMP